MEKSKHFIVLPSERRLPIITDGTTQVEGLMDFMSQAKAVSLDVLFEDQDGENTKPGKLILWGDVLKNSHLEIQ